ncbi:unnamed protein product [Caenorhabditis angaria]|uniref:Seven TM Receptor n=1 Tax=Caenorhabditis angaria TaxID=860376 RepID=A0A9P1IZG1_9PELO|nr:unnamed protein product [Caenorhabditis angaria]
MFGVSLGLFPVLFIYRYSVLSKNKLLATFESKTILIWLSIPLTSGLIFGTIACILTSPQDIAFQQLEPFLQNSLRISKENFEYLCLYFKSITMQDKILSNKSLLAVCLMHLLLICSLILISYFGLKCYKLINEKLNQSNASQEYRNIQTQFFYALVVQTMIPLALLHVPAVLVLLAGVFQINLGLISGCVPFAYAIFPAVDPLPTIFIIKSYWSATKLILKSFLTFPRRLKSPTAV